MDKMKENTNTALKNQPDNEGRFDAFVTPTLNTFYNDDCMNWLPKCPPNFFELAIVDPPYGIGMDNSNKRTKPSRPNSYTQYPDFRYHKTDWDVSPPSTDYFAELFRVSKNQIIFGANYFNKKLPEGFGWVFWNKRNGLNNRFSDGEFIYTTKGVQSRYIEISQFDGLNGGKDRIHPTQKPTKLYKWLLRNYAKAGDKILDTHAGSASCLVACKEMGFDYVGFEIDKDYWTIANERLGRAYYQPELFGRSG